MNSTAFEGWHSYKNHHITLIFEGGNREEREKEAIEAVPGKVLFYNKQELHRNFNTRHHPKTVTWKLKTVFISYHLRFSLFSTR